jgi:hypothetical protein
VSAIDRFRTWVAARIARRGWLKTGALSDTRPWATPGHLRNALPIFGVVSGASSRHLFRFYIDRSATYRAMIRRRPIVSAPCSARGVPALLPAGLWPAPPACHSPPLRRGIYATRYRSSASPRLLVGNLPVGMVLYRGGGPSVPIRPRRAAAPDGEVIFQRYDPE